MNVITMKSREAREKWRDMLDRVFRGGDVIIERYGKPVAALISAQDYNELREEIDELRSIRSAAEAYEAWQQNSEIARPLSDVEADLLSDGLLDE